MILTKFDFGHTWCCNFLECVTIPFFYFLSIPETKISENAEREKSSSHPSIHPWAIVANVMFSFFHTDTWVAFCWTIIIFFFFYYFLGKFESAPPELLLFINGLDEKTDQCGLWNHKDFFATQKGIFRIFLTVWKDLKFSTKPYNFFVKSI